MKKNIDKVCIFEKEISKLGKVIEKKLKDCGIDSEEKRKRSIDWRFWWII